MIRKLGLSVVVAALLVGTSVALVQATPLVGFSFSGANASVPESASLVALGTGLILASFGLGRRARKSN